MKYVRIFALILCLTLILTTFSASAFGTNSGIDLRAAIRTHSPDTVMLRAGDVTVNWGLFYFFLHDEVAQLTDGFLYEPDWPAPSPLGEGTVADLIKDFIVYQVSQSMPHSYAVNLLNIALSDDELDTLQQRLDADVEDVGGLRMFEAILRSGGIYDFETYKELIIDMMLQNMLTVTLLDDVPDDTVAEFAARNDFMYAKHILFMFPMDPASEEHLAEAKAELYEKAEGVLDELSRNINSSNFLELFDTLIFEHSDDNFPEGYLFQPDDMVESFSEACMALQPGQISGIVESPFGYHIILRLPLDYNMVPIALAQQGQNVSLRQLAGREIFGSYVQIWSEEMGEIEHTPELEALDLGEVFAWQN